MGGSPVITSLGPIFTFNHRESPLLKQPHLLCPPLGGGGQFHSLQLKSLPQNSLISRSSPDESANDRHVSVSYRPVREEESL